MKTIGSDSSNDVILSGNYIAKKHAQVMIENKQVILEDLGSTFGTFVNGTRIDQVTFLKKGDRVRIGTQVFHWNDYLEDELSGKSQHPIYIKGLISPFGIIALNDYKYVLIIALATFILIPFGVPTALSLLETILSRRSRLDNTIDLIQYSNVIIWMLSIVALYVFLNLTQKVIRGSMK